MSNFGGARKSREPFAGDDAEISEILGLARSLIPRSADYRKALESLIETTKAELARSARSIEAERISERFGRALRQL